MNINKILTSVENSYLKSDQTNLANFYKEGAKNPSVALVLERGFIKNKQDEMVSNPYGYTQFNNLEYKYRMLKEDKTLKQETKDFWNEFRKMYKKTGVLRTVLCKSDRIHPDKVTPKADIFENNLLWHMWKTHENNRCLADNYLVLKK